MHSGGQGARCPPAEGWRSGRTIVSRVPKSRSKWWEVLLLPRSWQSEPPLSLSGVSCLYFQSHTGERAAVWALVGEHPAAILEEGDSYPAKFPLKIHRCRQLSDVCDGNTWKDFYLQQQNRPMPGEAGGAPRMVLPPAGPAASEAAPPTTRSWVLPLWLSHNHSLYSLGKAVCLFFPPLCSPWSFLSGTDSKSSFPYMSPMCVSCSKILEGH